MNPGGLVLIAGGGFLAWWGYSKGKSAASSSLSGLGAGVTHVAGDVGSGVVSGADAVGSGVADAGKGVYHFLQPGTYHPGITTQAPESVNAALHNPKPVGAYVGPSSTALKQQQKTAPTHSGATVKPGFAVAAIPPPGFGASGHAAPHKAPKKVAKTPPKTSSHKKAPTKAKAGTGLVAL